MHKTHKHRGTRGRAFGHRPHILEDGSRPEPHEPGHSPGIAGHGRSHSVRSELHAVSMKEARRRGHSPAIVGPMGTL